MLKQLTTAFVILLSLGFFVNSCSDSNPTFKNPDPLDTGGGLVPDSLKPDPSDTSSDDTTADKPSSQRVRVAIPVVYDSTTSGGVQEIYLEGVEVELYESENGEAGNLIAKRTTNQINNAPGGAVDNGFSSKTGFPEQDLFALFPNNQEKIKPGFPYQASVDTIDYNGAELVLYDDNAGEFVEFVQVNIAEGTVGWKEKELLLKEN